MRGRPNKLGFCSYCTAKLELSSPNEATLRWTKQINYSHYRDIEEPLSVWIKKKGNSARIMELSSHPIYPACYIEGLSQSCKFKVGFEETDYLSTGQFFCFLLQIQAVLA